MLSIYGVGGIACWLLLRGIPDASSQFVAAALVCSVIEYSVGVLLEKTTGARFWDYSHLPFNLHGRICLYWACAFGLGALCICRLVEPALLGLLGHLPVLIVRLSAFIVAVAMMVDAFGCHGIGGILGGVLTGLFCVPELSWTGKGGLFYTGDVSLLVSQILGIVVTVAIVLVLDLVTAAVVKALVHGSLHVDEADEALGLDASQHGESAYPSFSGLD